MTFNDSNQGVDQLGPYRILDGIGENDTVEYVVSDELKSQIELSEKYIYDKVIIKYGPQDFSKEDYVIEVRPGYKLIDDYSYLLLFGGSDLLANVIQVTTQSEIKSKSGKLLYTAKRSTLEPNNPVITIPANVTEEDDIIYNLTDEEKEKIENQYDKIIINFSGHDYSGETRAHITDMHDKEEEEDLLDLLYDNINIISKFQYNMKYYLETPNGKKLAYFPYDIIGDNITDVTIGFYEAPTIICDGIGEADTIYYNIPEQSELRSLLPSNYKRIVIKFIPEEKTTPNKPNKTIIVNPKTINNLLIIFGIILTISISTIIMKKQNY